MRIKNSDAVKICKEAIKCRKVALIFYGNGIRTVLEFENINMDMIPNCKLEGKIRSVNHFGRKFIKQFRREFG